MLCELLLSAAPLEMSLVRIIMRRLIYRDRGGFVCQVGGFVDIGSKVLDELAKSGKWRIE